MLRSRYEGLHTVKTGNLLCQAKNNLFWMFNHICCIIFRFDSFVFTIDPLVAFLFPMSSSLVRPIVLNFIRLFYLIWTSSFIGLISSKGAVRYHHDYPMGVMIGDGRWCGVASRVKIPVSCHASSDMFQYNEKPTGCIAAANGYLLSSVSWTCL